MSITEKAGSVVADPGQKISLSSLFSVSQSTGKPMYLIVTALDRDEYTAGYKTSAMGTLSGNGAAQQFQDFDWDGWSVGMVFTYQPSTGLYYNPTYGYFNQLTFTASSNTNDNVSLSLYTTNNASLANSYAANPYVLSENPTYFGYAGSVSIVTQPSKAPQLTTQATPDSVCSAALSFVGDAWNMDGCWVLASNISAEAGASLPLTSTSIGVPGVANGEWIVAYNGPVSANSNWESQVTAGEIVAFETTSGGGHITTVVSGSGASAMLVDNITYTNQNGGIANPANDGSSSDIIVAASHPASQEFTGVNPGMVVVYELDTPTVKDLVSGLAMTENTSDSLASLFSPSNPVAGQSVTEWQVYATDTADAITVGGVAASAHSAATAVTAASLTGVALRSGSTVGTDTIEVRAYNGSYWGDWQSLTVTISAASAAPPTVTEQTPNQTWQQGQHVALTLPANTFTDPQDEKLSYTATLGNGQALPAWLSFNAATETFSGTAPGSTQSLTLKLTTTDTSGLSASETFTAAVQAPKPAITVTDHTPNQSWTAGKAVDLVLPADTFRDALGLKMTFAAYEVSGPNVTSWLHFNPATDKLFGNVPAATTGTIGLEVVASDADHVTAADLFDVTIMASSHGVTGATSGAAGGMFHWMRPVQPMLLRV